MKQKKVKIIGFRNNAKFGILQACEMTFDEKENLIVIKGGVGNGKTQLARAIQMGSMGGNAMKEDKNLYGKIDQETQLVDGEKSVYIGCKTDKNGDVKYILYTKDSEGKNIYDPIIDGVKATPASYLKELQTSLTWRMDELTSENPTTQKKIMMELYKHELAATGVIFDKTHPSYVGSILDKIEKAEYKRTEKDVLRKQVGGIASHLSDQGYDVNKPETLPVRKDIEELKTKRNTLNYDIDRATLNAGKAKEEKLSKINADVQEIVNKMLISNSETEKQNEKVRDEINEIVNKNNQIISKKDEIIRLIRELKAIEKPDEIINLIEKRTQIKSEPKGILMPIIPFANNRCTSTSSEGFEGEKAFLIDSLIAKRSEYLKIFNEAVFVPDTSKEKSAVESLNVQIFNAEAINKICDAVDAYNAWNEADVLVKDLKAEYSKMLLSIDTGVDGLRIRIDESDDKMNLFMMYNGVYSPEYFYNEKLEYRKLSAYSGTQRPVICLLIQNYLLSKKPKALRYLWIDNIPVDKKTMELLDKMSNDLELTLFVNITGDFDRDDLKNGEILVVGGELFFNGL